MKQKMNLMWFGAGMLILIATMLFMVDVDKNNGYLAVVPGMHDLGIFTNKSDIIFTVKISADKQDIHIGKIRLDFYEKGQEFPCKDSSFSISKTLDLSISKGQSQNIQISVPANKFPTLDTYYTVLVYAYNNSNDPVGSALKLTNTGMDNSQYDACYSQYKAQLEDPSNNCGIDSDTNKYYFCEGIGYTLTIKSINGEDNQTNDSNIEYCTLNQSYSCKDINTVRYYACVDGILDKDYTTISCGENQMCDQGVCINDTSCTDGDQYNITCSDDSIITTHICENNTWVSTGNTCPTDYSDAITAIAILGLFGAGFTLWYLRKEGKL